MSTRPIIGITGEDFVVGIQWHSEMMAKNHPVMLDIFKKLINVTKEKRG